MCLEREFPVGASEWTAADEAGNGMGRRQFIMLAGASLALAGLAGCSPRSREKIVPYADQPEQIIPGKPLFYASAMPLNGYGRGILVETEMGRPVKIEGNPAHPDSLGATDAVTQAAVLGLWDPDRSQAPVFNGHISTLEQVRERTAHRAQDGGRGAGRGTGRADGAEHVADVAKANGRTIQEVPEGAVLRMVAVCGRWVGDGAGFRRGGGGPDRLGGQRLPFGSTRQPTLHAAIRRTPPGAGRPGEPEPPVRTRRDADDHRHDGRRTARRAAGPCGGGVAPTRRLHRGTTRRSRGGVRGEAGGGLGEASRLVAGVGGRCRAVGNSPVGGGDRRVAGSAGRAVGQSCRAGGRPRRGHGQAPVHSRRQSGVQCTVGPALR